MKKLILEHKRRCIYLLSDLKCSATSLGIKSGDVLRVYLRSSALQENVSVQLPAITYYGGSNEPKPALQMEKLPALTYEAHNDPKTIPSLTHNTVKRQVKKSRNSYADEVEKTRQRHSRNMSRIFEEADPQFRTIRERLHSLTMTILVRDPSYIQD